MEEQANHIEGNAEGSCLCGGVRYRVDGKMRQIIACHYRQCRKQTGSHMTAIRASLGDFHLDDPHNLVAWYRSSAKAERGFCSRCGSTLFWRRNEPGKPDAGISIAAGGLDAHPQTLRVVEHIFTADKAAWFHPPAGEPVREDREDWAARSAMRHSA